MKPFLSKNKKIVKTHNLSVEIRRAKERARLTLALTIMNETEEIQINEIVEDAEELSKDGLYISIRTKNYTINIYSPWRMQKEKDIIFGCLDDWKSSQIIGKKIISFDVLNCSEGIIHFNDDVKLHVWACDTRHEFIEFIGSNQGSIQYFHDGDMHRSG